MTVAPFALADKQVLFVVAPERFRDEEYAAPRKVLEDRGATVKVASTRGGTAVGMLGVTLQPDLLVNDAFGTDWDAVVVVGGAGSPAHLWNDRALLALLKDRSDRRKVVAGICLSAAALARAGVLGGRRATCWPSPEAIAALEQGGATHERAGVVEDGHLITADGPASAGAFGEAVARALLE